MFLITASGIQGAGHLVVLNSILHTQVIKTILNREYDRNKHFNRLHSFPWSV